MQRNTHCAERRTESPKHLAAYRVIGATGYKGATSREVARRLRLPLREACDQIHSLSRRGLLESERVEGQLRYRVSRFRFTRLYSPDGFNLSPPYGALDEAFGIAPPVFERVEGRRIHRIAVKADED
jgi:hypothetical protein